MITGLGAMKAREGGRVAGLGRATVQKAFRQPKSPSCPAAEVPRGSKFTAWTRASEGSERCEVCVGSSVLDVYVDSGRLEVCGGYRWTKLASEGFIANGGVGRVQLPSSLPTSKSTVFWRVKGRWLFLSIGRLFRGVLASNKSPAIWGL